MDVSYDCEEGSLLKGVKLGDKVIVEYYEASGKKLVIKIKKPSIGC
jgi:Cu/Ag efflux protein CusF